MAVALVLLRGTVERLALETAKKQMPEYTEKRQGAGSTAVPTTTTTCRSRFVPPCCKPFVQSDRAWGHERKAQGRRGKFRLRRDFDRVGPDHSSHREPKCFQVKSGWPLVFELIASIARETEFTKFVGEAVATVHARHISRQGRVPVLVSCRARCNHHEARAGIVALISCCIVRLSPGGQGPSDKTACRTL